MTDNPFDPGEGAAGRQDGMNRARQGADPEWRRIILICFREVAERKPYFNTDDVERWRLTHYPNHTTPEKRALGPAAIEAAKHGYCERTDGFHVSTEKSNHCRPKRCWFSLIFRGRGRVQRPRRNPNPDPNQFDLFA
jgi:hypothetical protein